MVHYTLEWYISTVENSLALSYKNKRRTTVIRSNCKLYLSQRIENLCPQKSL